MSEEQQTTIKSVYKPLAPKNRTAFLVKELGIQGEKLPWPSIFCGVEIEVERCPYDSVAALHSEAINITDDNSLRNQGIEIITAPINSNVMIPTIEYILKKLPVGHDFSPRTSIHFHFNMQPWTLDQVKSLVYVYMLFENSFFRLVNPKRKESIFCVPVCDTDIYFNTRREDFPYLVENWHKYAAFNIKPLSNYGTVEFRHLQGTNNVEEIRRWFYCILALITFAGKQQDSADLLKTICDLNTNSEYEMFGVRVFGECFQHIFDPVNYQKDLEHCIKAIKAFKRNTLAAALFKERSTYLQEKVLGGPTKEAKVSGLYSKYLNLNNGGHLNIQQHVAHGGLQWAAELFAPVPDQPEAEL